MGIALEDRAFPTESLSVGVGLHPLQAASFAGSAVLCILHGCGSPLLHSTNKLSNK